MLLLLTPLLSSAAVLNLNGDSNNEVHFQSASGTAVLSATCASRSAGWLGLAERTFTMPSFEGKSISVVLANVPPTCAAVSDLHEPCASDSSHVPPLFFCNLTNIDTGNALTIGPVHAMAEAIVKGGSTLAFRSTLACPIPSHDKVAAVGNYAGDGSPVTLSVRLLFFSASGAEATVLPFRGVRQG